MRRGKREETGKKGSGRGGTCPLQNEERGEGAGKDVTYREKPHAEEILETGNNEAGQQHTEK